MRIERALQALLARWPARLTLPVALLSLCAVVLLAQFHLRSEQARSHARLELTHALAELAGQTARRLEAMAELDRVGARRGVVTRLGLYPAVREAWLFDAQGRTLAGLRRADQARGILDIGRRLSPAEAELLAAGEALPGGDTASLQDDVLRLQLEPVLIRSDPPEYGRLVVLGDSRPGEAEALQALRHVFRGEALVVVLGAVVLWWLLRLQLLDRGARLQQTAQALYQSGSAPYSDVAGNDELGQIGRAMDAGLDRFKRHEVVQRLALEGTRVLQALDTAQARVCWLAERLVQSGGFVAVRVRAQGPEGPVLIERHAAGIVTAPERAPARRYALAAEPGNAAAPACLEVWQDLSSEAAEREWFDVLELLVNDLQAHLAREHAERARRRAERRVQLAMEAAELGDWQLQLDPPLLRLSPRALAMLRPSWTEGSAADESARRLQDAIELAQPVEWLAECLHPEDTKKLRARLVAGQACPTLLDEEFRVRSKEGWAWLLGRGTVVERDAEGDPRVLAGVLIDIDTRKRSESALRLASEVFQNSQLGIQICDAEGVIIDVNAAFERITGFDRAEAIGQRPSLLSSGHHPPDFYEGMWARLVGEGRWEGEVWNRRRDGTVYPQWLTITRVDDLQGRPLHYIGQFIETSDRKAFESRIEYLAAHDLLTGLPRRERLIEALQAELDAGLSSVGLLHLDIDRFRQINESLGYGTGDLLLRAVASRVAALLPANAWLSRVSADEFLVLVPMLDRAATHDQAERLHAAMSEPFDIEGHELALGLSIGFAIGPEDASEAEALANAAELALGAAQLAGRNGIRAYTPELAGHGLEVLTLESQMRQGLQRNEYFVVYQPQIDLRTGELAGFEALVRWRHPDRGLVSPAEFIPLAERTGLIIALGEFVLREACAAAVRLRQRGLPAVPVSVNVSTLQFRREDFEVRLEAALSDSGLPAQALELELTESVLMDHADAVLLRLDRLRARGLKLAIDDFGTGFSSLSYLGRLRPDRLKIDQSFVRGMGRSVTSQGVVKAILALAEEFGLATVAEGVETHEEAAVLRALGCDAGQGYLFARPQEEHLLRWPLAPAGQEQDRPTPTSP